MNRDKQIVIRASEGERRLWEAWAEERDINVSDLIRRSVSAYVRGEVGIPFAPLCRNRLRHVPGRTCPGCGGSARPAT